jgi:putative ABC transport system permease protein
VGRDLRFALRVLAKSPAFAAAVVLSLALGIGANSAIFTLMDAVMWRMLPVQDPQSLLAVGRVFDGAAQPAGFTYEDYRLLHDNNESADLAGYSTAPINVSVDGPPEPTLQGQLVSGDYFALLGVSPVIGRALGPEDDRVQNGHPVVMLSHGTGSAGSHAIRRRSEKRFGCPRCRSPSSASRRRSSSGWKSAPHRTCSCRS